MELREPISADEAASVYAALSQVTRLEAYRLLLRYQPFGLAAGDIARLLAVPHNTLSTHMATLVSAGLVRSRRQGRSIIYAADPHQLSRVGCFLDQGRAEPPARQRRRAAVDVFDHPTKRPSAAPATDHTYNVLVLCTGNAARSILAEALIAQESAGRFTAFSAGSRPRDVPDPHALQLLQGLGYDTRDLRCKSWTEFAEPGAPAMDFIITVCDAAAGETCPRWPGHPLTAHWGLPDPAQVTGCDEHRRAAFHQVYRYLMTRITAFVNLPIEQLSLDAMKDRLRDIARMEGATAHTLRGLAA